MTTTRGLLVWLTGLSGAGKTTIARELSEKLLAQNFRVQIVDGDEFRSTFCPDLGFSLEDRIENVRRIAALSNLLVRNGIVVVVAAISPLKSMRDFAKASVPEFVEVFVDAPVSICEQRDPKGLYKKARTGELKGFTGIDAPYEPPENPDVCCSTNKETVNESVEKVFQKIISEIYSQHPQPLGQSAETRRKTIAVDFDGVIAEYDGWQGDELLGKPRHDVIYVLRLLQEEGWKVLIHTTRCELDIKSYLLDFSVPFDEINSNTDYKNKGPKPVATIYWDDRALRYSGNAHLDLAMIRTFRTWSGR